MKELIIKPERGLCVETVARRRYWKAVDRYMVSGCEDRESEEEIEILLRFLEDENLPAYRSMIEDEIGRGRSAYLILSFSEDGGYRVRMGIDDRQA
ncbi:MAG TPA: hypothetical protein ENG09_07620 [Candidatus Syntrophoarchaeum butanivorans]|uniref:Uncharacterized protein n=1 Tax=Candidatus Syntropharchaeum butanivorans TaxID=1839936 RepID=A0A7C0X5C5_9EURY|nr:MAG: hypothetical protein CW694_00235 [Candidatus Syntrophoarchaeum sp. WYZ-LMO15]HDM37086.1 hypothetical protein [Candidatus Syntrophoarchaeum butanivorans]